MFLDLDDDVQIQVNYLHIHTSRMNIEHHNYTFDPVPKCLLITSSSNLHRPTNSIYFLKELENEY